MKLDGTVISIKELDGRTMLVARRLEGTVMSSEELKFRMDIEVLHRAEEGSDIIYKARRWSRGQSDSH